VDLVPEEFRSEGILVALGGSAVAGKRFLIPRAKEARGVLPETLRRMGAHVDVVETYRSARPKSIDRSVLRLIEEGKIHWVTFTSSSTVKNFFSLLPRHLLGRVREMGIACIGPVTAATVRARGFEPSVVPDRYTAHSLAQAIALASQAGKAP
jgi:uroporphyrinogen III methyltransferase/synthase